MWHEARKQERKIRGMLVDYRKRAERRQDFYEKIVSDGGGGGATRTNIFEVMIFVFFFAESRSNAIYADTQSKM